MPSTAATNAGEAAASAATNEVEISTNSSPLSAGISQREVLPLPCMGTCDSGSNSTPLLDTSNIEPLKSVEGIALLAEAGSMIPGLGVPFAIIAGTIRLGQGRFVDASIDLAAVVPLGGVANKVVQSGKLVEEAGIGYRSFSAFK